jgi:Spy/CpxP family protein refolding chaperone
LFCKRSVRRHVLASALAGLAAVALGVPAAAQDSQYWDIQYGPVGQRADERE